MTAVQTIDREAQTNSSTNSPRLSRISRAEEVSALPIEQHVESQKLENPDQQVNKRAIRILILFTSVDHNFIFLV